MSASIWIAVNLIAMLSWHLAMSAPTINSSWGTIQGVDIEGQNGRRISGYLGIPYAVPPVGALRWQKAKPHPGPVGDKIFNAARYMPGCPQDVSALGVYNGTNEDCLTLNVFVPANRTVTKSLLPVMVWIHGGYYSYGDAPVYRPISLVADGGVIVVTIQYRLGVFGFLHSYDAGPAFGNFGLWDQNLALHWVKDNILAFGGDPDLITIFGQSAGGMSVGLHIMSPHSRGLFKRAILQSGSPLLTGNISGDIPRQKSMLVTIGQSLDCKAESDSKILECLKTRSEEDIINKTVILQKEKKVYFLPHVDGDFIPRDLDALMQNESYIQDNGIGNLDILTGFTNNEGATLLSSVIMDGMKPEILTNPALFPYFLKEFISVGNKGKVNEVISKVVEFFYRGADAGTQKPISVDMLLRMQGDVLFYAPCIQMVRYLATLPRAGALFLYSFDHDANFNKGGLAQGMHHGDDLFYEFDLLSSPSYNIYFSNKSLGISKEEEPMFDLFVKILTDFAKTGNPNTPLRGILESDWPQYTTEDQAYLSLSLTPSVQHEVFKERVALWLQLLPQLKDAMERPTQEQTTVDPGNSSVYSSTGQLSQKPLCIYVCLVVLLAANAFTE